ncbi:MAG: alginate lyase family protein [Candidatus Hydrogenedentes bacterium]|nr:alginate lyase family protein [Candidatus Hydrogenedentota bacterium]
MTLRRATGFILFLLFNAFAFNTRAAEILADTGSLRVVTGDWAARTTRGIEGQPVSQSVTQDQVRKLIEACQVKEALPFAAQLGDGIARHGWAQFELEPETAKTTVKLRVWGVGGNNPAIQAECSDIDKGIQCRATFSLPDGKFGSEKVNTAENLDRSVYRSLISTEYFVLSQEHFEKQFLESMINLDTTGLEPVRTAYAAHKPVLALYELAEYYRRKTTPAELIKKPADKPASATDPVAEDICRHIFKQGGATVDMGPVIHWSRHPVEVKEWLWNFNNHHHFVQLLDAYLSTRNERYTDEFGAQVADWIVENPAPPYTLTRVATWRNLEAGGRCSRTWPAAFYGFLSSPHFTPQHIQLMLGSLWSHGDYLLKHPAGLRKPNNWSVVDSTGLAAVGAYWPELTGADEWRKTGYERLTNQLRMQVYPDGAQYELAPSYHNKCLADFDIAYQLARDSKTDLPREFAQRLESMYDYLMWIAKPSGLSPTPSDSGALDTRKVLATGAERFNRDDFRYIATSGAQGKAPDGLSHVLAHAGYYAMRSGWDSQALFLFFDGGPLGVSHSHEDKLAFELSAYGRDFLIDPGPYHYTNDQWRQYFVSTAAHSTILIDGLGQNRSSGIELEAPEHPKPIWQSDDTLDFASATYDSGYGPDHLPVTHRRSIVFVKPQVGPKPNKYPGFWIILDEIAGEGTHRVESLFHYAPGLTVTQDADLSVRTTMPEGPNLRITPAPHDGLQAAIITGQETPTIQGWYALGHNDRQPAPVVSYSVTAKLPLTLCTLLHPVSQGEAPTAKLIARGAGPSTYQATVAFVAGSSLDVTFDTANGHSKIDWPTNQAR